MSSMAQRAAALHSSMLLMSRRLRVASSIVSSQLMTSAPAWTIGRELHELDRRLEPLRLRLALGARVRGDGRELPLPPVRVPELLKLAREEVVGSRPEGLSRCLAGRGRRQEPSRHRQEEDPALVTHEVGAVTVRESVHHERDDGLDDGLIVLA